MSKDTTVKNDKEYNLDVFKNYKCDGQLVMDFSGAEIKFKEEEKVSKVTGHRL